MSELHFPLFHVFSDLSSVVSLLGGQFLADIEHICLGSVSYDSDTSSSATSRSVGSIVSDASRASDGSRGCRPRVTNTTAASRSHCFTFPSHLPHLVQEHLLPDSDHNSETQEQLPEVQPASDKDSSKAFFKCNSHKAQCNYDPSDSESVLPDQHPLNYSRRVSPEGELTEITGHRSVFSEALSRQTKGASESVDIPNSTPTDNGKFSDEDHEREAKETNTICDSPCSEGMGSHLQDNSNQNCEIICEGNSTLQNKSSASEKESNDGTEAERKTFQLTECDNQVGEVPQALQSPKTRVEETQEESNSGNDSGQGKEAQNAAALTLYLQKGCGAKILVALDQLGVAVSLLYGRCNFFSPLTRCKPFVLVTLHFIMLLCYVFPYIKFHNSIYTKSSLFTNRLSSESLFISPL